MSQLPPALLAKFDQMFMTMTQESGGLNPFLDCMFSFLQRRTDFYYEAEPGDNMGFPPGYSEQIVSTLTALHRINQPLLFDSTRSSASTRSTARSTKSASHPRVMLSSRDGMISRRLRKQLLRPRRARLAREMLSKPRLAPPLKRSRLKK